ncbi:MAG TPA: hypothetical protein VML75_24325 [Kofleriaceae bacterium]|nr:hypothetical protein [Kofleriaceae bacterium]
MLTAAIGGAGEYLTSFEAWEGLGIVDPRYRDDVDEFYRLVPLWADDRIVVEVVWRAIWMEFDGKHLAMLQDVAPADWESFRLWIADNIHTADGKEFLKGTWASWPRARIAKMVERYGARLSKARRQELTAPPRPASP